ncbi:GTPase domain-containing protein [Actinokineospora inagensis]|uniref:GTPase domain-containing protein n=1 Tax=Actinokineospora inagensis TaxID=103730 RepID=UPI00041AEDC4|nr:GTPase domain-containing protein [Actinokineospora inagensis]
MTGITPFPRLIRCPICADEFPWSHDPIISVWDDEKRDYLHIDTSSWSAEKRADLAQRGYRQCPNPSGDTQEEHYLPATFGDFGDPMVIGLVGGGASGKTHLLTAMIRQAYLNGLAPYDITVKALDHRRHRSFREKFIEEFERGAALAGTDTGISDAADILLLRGPAGVRPITFFDVAGEDLRDIDARNRSTRFLIGATAVIFVHPCDDRGPDGQVIRRTENLAFDLAVERLRSKRLPAVVAVTKADRLRYAPPVERWLRRGDETSVDADRIRAESRDVYAFLHHSGAGGSLEPYQAFPRCTLHFVSASGGEAAKGAAAGKNVFPRGFHPTRVLEPLVSILAMTGMITGPEAERVGMP